MHRPELNATSKEVETWEKTKSRLRITSAKNEILIDENGNRLIDLFSGNGTAWLGHANQRINERLASQLEKTWITGGLETPAYVEARTAIESLFPPSHKLGVLYSTGMEAAEFAIRVARGITGRPDVVGFEKSMHGKSLATAYLGWDNHDRVLLPQFHRLPFVSTLAEEEILERLKATLRAHPISAVFIEPLQGSGGGHSASDSFYKEVYRLCRESGALLVFDEILTGFYRTGQSFYLTSLGFFPDLILIGKAMGNGFPVSGVVMHNDHKITPQMLPGSTYAGNPLACTAIAATLEELHRIEPLEKVAAIEQIIINTLTPVTEYGFQLRGRGAMWIIECPLQIDIHDIALRLFRRGVLMSHTGRILRFLPAVTILPDNLAAACNIVREELITAYVI